MRTVTAQREHHGIQPAGKQLTSFRRGSRHEDIPEQSGSVSSSSSRFAGTCSRASPELPDDVEIQACVEG